MIEHYENPEDAIPYETTVLVLSKSDTSFEEPIKDVLGDVRSMLYCDKQHVEGHYYTLDDLPVYDKLIQYNVWIIHHSCLLVDGTPPLLSYLKSESFPDETQILIYLETSDEQMSSYVREEVEQEYSEKITVLTTETEMTYYLLGHLKTATPCSAAGLDHLVSWNNKISDNVGRHKDVE